MSTGLSSSNSHIDVDLGSRTLAPNVTVIWVPGAWHGPEPFAETAELLQKATGLASRLVTIPSAGKVLDDVYEDSSVVRSAILHELNEANKNVVLVVHSYGGVCGSNACEGLSQEARGEGSTALLGTIYLTAFCPGKGNTLWELFGNQGTSWFVDKGDVVEVDGPQDVFYNDCSPSQQAFWSGALEPFSYNCFKSQILRYEVWRDVPSTYLFCELDKAIPLDVQRQLVEDAKSFLYTRIIRSGHSPFLSMPKETADFIAYSIRNVICCQDTK